MTIYRTDPDWENQVRWCLRRGIFFRVVCSAGQSR